MRLRKFEIFNFKAIQHIELEWDDFLVLLGENNCGKSCVLSALAWFLSGSAIKDSQLFHRHETDEANAIELIGYFDQLTPIELGESAIANRTVDGEWILKKKFWLEESQFADDGKASWKEQLYTLSAPEEFIGWPSPDTSWSAFGPDYEPLIAALPGAGNRPNAASKEQLRQSVRANRPDLINRGNPVWMPNPGGGGNWKSNANSLLPRCVFIRAVQEASDESISKDASTSGKLVNLIVENQLAARQEIQDLKLALERVLELFSPDEENPDRQAVEIRDLEAQINQGLRQVIGGEARIRTDMPDINSLLLPSTSLIVRDASHDIDTKVSHQGHGLQRTLVITLLQLLVEAQESTAGAGISQRPVVLLVEEPELYLHPQMERRMRDLLYRLTIKPSFQVACCTHSPVFVDVSNRHKAIVRMSRDRATGNVSATQVVDEIFVGNEDEIERQKLQTVARFNSNVNEVFFSSEVVLVEEFTAVAAFERAADLTGLFERHPDKKRGVSFIDAAGKGNIPAFQKVLNAFGIPYRVVHDEDRSNPNEFSKNLQIAGLAINANPPRPIHLVGPESIENTLDYVAPKSGAKPFAAVKKIEELHAQDGLPQSFIEAMNFAYFGSLIEPPPIMN